MNFIEAVKAARDGKKIRRKDWTDPQLTAYAISGWLYMSSLHCPAKHMEVSVDGSLADDWEIVPEPPKTMGFMEAWAEAKKGKKIARLAWGNGKDEFCVYGTHAPGSDVGLLFRWQGDFYGSIELCNTHIDATDWYVVKENEGVGND